ncbi:4-hydroxyphenylacetate catabolism regulator HpaA [Xanthomonas fragariae]|uniref:4-hydroxyphenylacetate catabolism regulator HpaA n=1 Tax=Xanthomonas fragariae TaxID=48664 RepID=UPI000A35C399|nr:4-hydroxyphenylacetate catabolism regulator HpaA [Xanthomonas fragariae]SMQ96002.1 HpaA protein [Xanthomonas fragariae]
MIRRISRGGVPTSVPTEHASSNNHADAPHAGLQQLEDKAQHGPRLRPAPPRRRRRGMRALDGLDDALDSTELEEAEAARVAALRGRVKIAVDPSQGHSQDNQHGDGGNSHAGNPQARKWPITAPVQLDDSVRASVEGVLNRYAATRAADQTATRRAFAVALVELRAIGIAHPAAASLTALIWRLMRDHLRSGSAPASAETLNALRERLVNLVPPQPDASLALRSFHLLLPLVLLNAEKPRKRLDRARAVKRLDTLLIEYQDGTAQGIRA